MLKLKGVKIQVTALQQRRLGRNVTLQCRILEFGIDPHPSNWPNAKTVGKILFNFNSASSKTYVTTHMFDMMQLNDF